MIIRIPALFLYKWREYMKQEMFNKIRELAIKRKSVMTQKEMSEVSGVSRSNIANFEAGRVNNMYLYDLYLDMFKDT